MRDFNFLIRDKRYSVPTLQFVAADDLATARELALTSLAESNDHTAVEVWDGGAMLFTVVRDDAVSSTQPANDL